MIEIPAKASQIVERARSVSDLPASKFISHIDELNSLNEAWKDIYSKLTDSDDDYYVTDVDLTLSSTYAVSGHPGEYLIPLPSNFYKLRYLDFQAGGVWRPVGKFTPQMRDYHTGNPYYRLKGAYLWVLWKNPGTASSTIRMGYYPPPASITVPASPLEYGTSYARNLFALVTAPGYAPYNKIMVYAYGATFIITAESVTLGTVSAPVALFTDSGAVTNLVYYKGSLYWIRGGLIWYKATALIAAFTAPSQATAPSGVTSFFIINNTIYYTNATQVRSCSLTGASDALVSANVGTSVAAIFAAGVTTVFYVNASAALIAVSPATTLFASAINKVQSDGTYLYIRDTSNLLRKLTLSIGTTITTTTDTTMQTDALDIGQPQTDGGITILPVLTSEAQTLQGVDVAADYTFTYPSNLVPEIMAYQSAIDYRSKQGEDTEDLKTRLITLWSRFEAVVKRDEYSVAHIGNVYDEGSWGWPS